MKTKSNIDHLVVVVILAVVTSVIAKLFILGPLGLAILAACAIVVYAKL